ncbi:MAG TPA: CBS domain-containing protein [Gemmatimonadales bacterium]
MTLHSRVGDLMSTALVFVRETDTLAIARREMRRAGIRHLPVVDDHQNLIGVISTTDLTGSRHPPDRTQRIGKFMSRSVVTVTPETSLTLARDLMLENAFRSLPVVGSDGHLIGILTETDLLRGMRAVDPGSGGNSIGRRSS